jgi:hypothetical protein
MFSKIHTFPAKSSVKWGKVADHKLRIWHDDVLTQFAMSRQGASVPSRGITNVVQKQSRFLLLCFLYVFFYCPVMKISLELR